MELIWAKREAKYFLRTDWTVDSALIGLAKFDFWRKWILVQPSFRGDAEHRTRNLEIPGLVLAHHPGMTGDHRPLNFGLRFSMNACRPSRKSSESMQAIAIAFTASMSRSLLSFNTCAIVILLALIDSGALSEIVRATSSVPSQSLSSSNTRSTSPIRKASPESIRIPVYRMSRAWDGPTSETRFFNPS